MSGVGNFQWMLVSFWLHLGSILSPCKCPFWLILEPWGFPGLSWERHGSSREPEGSRRRSWERRAGSLDPLGCHKATPKWLQKFMEKHYKICMIFLVPRGRPNQVSFRYQNPCKKTTEKWTKKWCKKSPAGASRVPAPRGTSKPYEHSTGASGARWRIYAWGWRGRRVREVLGPCQSVPSLVFI